MGILNEVNVYVQEKEDNDKRKIQLHLCIFRPRCSAVQARGEREQLTNLAGGLALYISWSNRPRQAHVRVKKRVDDALCQFMQLCG